MRYKKTCQSCKILFFDHSLQLGGGELSLFDIIKNLGINNVKKYKKVFVTPSKSIAKKFEETGAKCIFINLPKSILNRSREKIFSLSDIYNLPIAIVRFLTVLQKEKPDIIYTNTQKSHLIGGITSFILRKPLICHFRDILPTKITLKIWLKLIYLFSKRIIAISNAVCRQFNKKKKIKVIYVGIKGHSSPVIENNQYLVGYVGQISEWKGIEYFIKSMPLILKELPETNFLIVGSPIFGDYAYFHKLKELVIELGITNNVKFIPHQENVFEIINKLTILVHPSILPEPFGRILIEAGSFGKPVVATRCGATTEIIIDGVTGILVPTKDEVALANEIIKLLKDKETRKRLGENAKEIVKQKFELNSKINEIEEIIKEVI